MIDVQGYDFGKSPEVSRREYPATKEANLIGWALGLEFRSIPVKVVNPNINDIEEAVDNMGGKGLGKKILGRLMKSNIGGLADPTSNKIYDISGREYLKGIFGVLWPEALTDVSDVSLHEAGHQWLGENIPSDMMRIFKRVELSDGLEAVSETEIETSVCARVVSEGVATYIAKRCNDFIRDAMVKAVTESFPDDPVKIERCSKEYESYYDASHIAGGKVEEDLDLTERSLKIMKKGIFARMSNLKTTMNFNGVVVYRLGYNLIDRMVAIRIKAGMTEAEALKDIAANPPTKIEHIKGILGFGES